MKENVNCPVCGKVLCKMEHDGSLAKVYLYCKRCKREIYISTIKKED